MNKLYLLTDKALDELKSKIIVDNYLQNEPFIEKHFSGRKYRSSIDIDLELPQLIFSNESEDKKWMQDFENSKKLYSVINSKNIPLRYLVDERFWAYLSHTFYWNYLIVRWPVTSEKMIIEKWFFAGGNQVFSRQPLVRLWWLSECSYDENREDPFELTKVAFQFQDPFNQVLERRISKSRKVFKAVLRAFKDTPNAVKLKTDINRTTFGKAINTIAGVKLLDALTEDELYEIFVKEITNIVFD